MRRHHYLIPISIGVITLGSFRPAEGQQRTPPPPEFVNWLPLSDAERDLKTPGVDKDAGAEIVVWRVHVVDELLRMRIYREYSIITSGSRFSTRREKKRLLPSI